MILICKSKSKSVVTKPSVRTVLLFSQTIKHKPKARRSAGFGFANLQVGLYYFYYLSVNDYIAFFSVGYFAYYA